MYKLYKVDEKHTLRCSNNNIEILPELTNIKALYCSNNKIKVLPDLSNVTSLQ